MNMVGIPSNKEICYSLRMVNICNYDMYRFSTLVLIGGSSYFEIVYVIENLKGEGPFHGKTLFQYRLLLKKEFYQVDTHLGFVHNFKCLNCCISGLEGQIFML